MRRAVTRFRALELGVLLVLIGAAAYEAAVAFEWISDGAVLDENLGHGAKLPVEAVGVDAGRLVLADIHPLASRSALRAATPLEMDAPPGRRREVRTRRSPVGCRTTRLQHFPRVVCA